MNNSDESVLESLIATATGPVCFKAGRSASLATSDSHQISLGYLDKFSELAASTDYEDFHRMNIDARLLKIEKEMREIKEMLQANTRNEDNLPELRGIDMDQAKSEIALYFRENDGREVGYEELIEGLQIEPSIVVRACNALVDEGKIG